MIDVFFPGFNFSFMVIFLYLGLAIDIVIFRYYKINYVYLFELDPSINLIVVSIFNVKYNSDLENPHTYSILGYLDNHVPS
jgi:hypothetical protein